MQPWRPFEDASVSAESTEPGEPGGSFAQPRQAKAKSKSSERGGSTAMRAQGPPEWLGHAARVVIR